MNSHKAKSMPLFSMDKDIPELIGRRVRLRPFHLSDVAGRFALGRSPEIVHSFGGNPEGLPPYRERDAQSWVERNIEHPLCWAVEVDDRLLGEARLGGLDLHNRRARLATGLYDVSQLGKGLGRELIKLVLSHAFGTMRLHRVDLRVLAFNERAIRCYRACGFVEEGREREGARIGDVWHDDIIMGLLAEDYQTQAS
ncbi:GNAT family protein [Vannielia sp.]|uniref:GNAT family N-acetyltransferase n=1 Tax=Vannielia sp. TaxID=2813045 RepID=UPI00263816EA|nr:GNAT family protein [Vannielia sp.]MDF1873331.1 GNAT family protein [Vannielia sp.]